MRKLVIVGVTVGLLLILGALRSYDLWSSREGTIARAHTRASSFSLLMSAYMAGTFAATDAALRQLAIHSQRIGGPRASPSEWTPSLVSARAGLTAVGALSVIDTNLVIRQSTRTDILGHSRRGDPMMEEALRSDGDQLLVGQPFLSPVVGNGYLLPVGRRLTSNEGVVEGAVVASYLPFDLRRFFQSVSVGERGMVSVFHISGRVLFREPSDDDPFGELAGDNPVFAAAQRGNTAGIVDAPLTPDGPTMLSAYQKVPDLPLIVAVSLDRDEVIAAWWREVQVSAATYAAVSGVLIGILFVLARQIDANEANERELQRSRVAEAERLRETNAQLSALLEREQAARQEAEHASALKDQFVMTVSHELRTPLTAIAGWARMLVDGMVSEDKREGALRSIERNAQAQKRLIEDLLDVAGIMAGKLRLDIRSVPVAEVVRNAVEAIAPAANAKHIRLDTSMDPRVGDMAVDPERLQQIVWNLLSNAVKFTPSGGRVTLAVVRRPDALQITVSDTGPGISADLLPHVFERFRQGTGGTTKGHGGLGLGLAIVRNLVELHGGTVQAYSEGNGTGARFEVLIPAA